MISYRDTFNGGPIQWLHESYDCKRNCVKDKEDECCVGKPDDMFCLPDVEEVNGVRPDNITVSLFLHSKLDIFDLFFSMNQLEELSMVDVNNFISSLV